MDEKELFEQYWKSPNSAEYDKALVALTDKMGHGLPNKEAKDLLFVIFTESRAMKKQRKSKLKT